MTVAAIVLAAGASRRLGQPKQLIEYGGRPLVRHAAEQASAAGCDPVIVVTGAFSEPVEAVLDHEQVSIAHNDDWEAGQGGSVATGMDHLKRRQPDVDAVLLLLCDQPAIEVSHLRALIAAALDASHDIAATGYPDGSGGVPACFTRRCFDRLSALRGDRGAQSLMSTSAYSVVRLDAPQAALDVDTPEDVARLDG